MTARIEPLDVVEIVEHYVTRELADQKQYDNRQPLDESGVNSLHRLAADVYALGFTEGEQAAGVRNRAQASRDRTTP